MENQNRFDLEQALRAWRDDWASRPGISFDNARELESDLRERVADLVKQGLTEEEAFGRAARQVGSPGELAREFARENPLAVWRERLFWIVAAGFAVSVWVLLTDGPLDWCYKKFGAFLPFPYPGWFCLAGNLPLLALAVLVATGRLENIAARLRFFGRRHLALAGGCLLGVGLLVKLFGPCPLAGTASLPVRVFAVSLWPLLLLFLGIGLFRPTRVPESAGLALARLGLPAVAWRERVLWMGIGGLAVGAWRTVSWVTMQALFYTGDINMPFAVNGSVFIGSFLLITLSPLIVLRLLLRQRVRAGKDVTAGKLVRSRAMLVFIPAAVCAWTALYLWSQHCWKPAGFDNSWSSIVANYFTQFRWVWPAGLAGLILWLAPRGANHTAETTCP